MIDLDNCNFVVWGYKNVYHTHSHIHEGFYRALKLSGKKVEWLDEVDDIKYIDFSNTFFITNHDCTYENGYWPWNIERKSKIPIRDDCFYVIHGLRDNATVLDIFRNHKNIMSWNVLSMSNMRHNLGLYTNKTSGNEIFLDTDSPFDILNKHLEFRWATDLLPYEIEANKPNEMLSLKNKTINWVGTIWHVNEKELGEFINACDDDGTEFLHIGAGQNGIVSIEENIRLIRESYMAPAISGTHHLSEGYVPCRIFKNISYGQYVITNNSKANEIFGKKLIFNNDPYKLYYEAKEKLQSIKIEDLHSLMDEVAQKHTYLNRIAVMMQAAKMIAS